MRMAREYRKCCKARTCNITIARHHCAANQCSARRLDCRFYENSEASPYDPAKATDFYRRSVFCIQPPSDMPLRSSVFDAAVNGCAICA
jgi:hypothetical protein